MGQIDRERVMGRFRSGSVTILVATDVAARGLDIPEVDLVVHYRLPDQSESYQHRSGRTGRAGRPGKVVILYGPREKRELESLEREVKRSFRRINGPTPEEVMEAKWAVLARRIARQPEADKKLWHEQAQRLMAEGGVDAVAGMLALILGGAPTPKSLLTGEENWVTLKLSGSRISVNRVVAVMKGAGAGEIGRIRLDGEIAGYVDIRPEEVSKLDHSVLRDLRLMKATEVPSETKLPQRQECKGQGFGRQGQGPRRSQGERRLEGPAEDRREGERKRIVYR
jgi:ATP-dependent RNA helicase DeaD